MGLTKSRGVTTTGAGTSSTLATRVNGGLRFTGWSTIDNTYFGSGGLTTSYITARNANTDVTHGHLYQLWDAGKIQGCKCDLGYDGPDCSHRVSPHGDDPLTTVKSSMMKQVVQIGHDDDSAFATDARKRDEFLRHHRCFPRAGRPPRPSQRGPRGRLCQGSYLRHRLALHSLLRWRSPTSPAGPACS